VYREGGLKAVALAIADRLRQALGRDFRPMLAYAESPDEKPAPDNSELALILNAHEGNIVTKWHHYPEIYEEHFSRFRGTGVRFLEIGVSRGGSLDIWRKYFGENATIFGIDIDTDCTQYDGLSGSVRIGSQADADFLTAVVDEMGGVDIVIDDGSHNSRHIRKTLELLFPKLSNGGVYMIEDLHCAYLPRFGGGYRWPWSFTVTIKRLVDDMHHWYHSHGRKHGAISNALYGMHVYDSIVVLDKRLTSQPVSFHRPASH
jgi:hypothetical protein